MSTPIASLPDTWVKAAMLEHVKPDSLIVIDGGAFELPEGVGTGQRYAMVRDYTASRYMKGLSKDEIWALVKSEVGPRFENQKTEAALRADFERAWKGTAKRLGPPMPPREPTPDPGPGIDAADLIARDLPPLRMVVPGLLPEGTSILASPPKVGKSSLVYQIATEVAVGGELFGERVESGSALYFALEDGERRGQTRLLAALNGRTMPWGRLEIRWSARKLGAGLEEDIAEWLDEHHDAALVAIDTLGRVRPRGGEKRNAYDVDVEMIGRLQDLFRDRSVALLLVHHTNKGSHDDFVAQVSGTYGISGSVDTVINVNRKRLEAFGSITVTGRDVADSKLSVRFDELIWSAAPESLTEGSFQRTEVYRTIEEIGPAWPLAIADRLGLERTSVQHLVTALVDTGAVRRTAKGYAATFSLSIPSHSSHSESEEGERVEKEHPRSAWDVER